MFEELFYWTACIFLDNGTFLIPQVGHAYMNRPCLDPSDTHCPLSAPNKEKEEVNLNIQMQL